MGLAEKYRRRGSPGSGIAGVVWILCFVIAAICLFPLVLGQLPSMVPSVGAAVFLIGGVLLRPRPPSDRR